MAVCIEALTCNQNSHMVVCANPAIAVLLYAFTNERRYRRFRNDCTVVTELET